MDVVEPAGLAAVAERAATCARAASPSASSNAGPWPRGRESQSRRSAASASTAAHASGKRKFGMLPGAGAMRPSAARRRRRPAWRGVRRRRTRAPRAWRRARRRRGRRSARSPRRRPRRRARCRPRRAGAPAWRRCRGRRGSSCGPRPGPPRRARPGSPADSRAMLSPRDRHASAASVPRPPEFVTTATLRPPGSGWRSSSAAVSNSAWAPSTRSTPAWRNSASNTASPRSARPVWDPSPSPMATSRWPLTATIGLRRDTPAGEHREAPRVAEALHVERDDRHALVVLPPLEQVVRGDVGAVAERDEARHAEPAAHRLAEQPDAEGAGLRGDRQPPGRRLDLAHRRVQRNGGIGVDEAEAVGADEPDAVVATEVEQLLLAPAALLVALGEAGRDDDQRADAGARRVAGDVEDLGRRGRRGSPARAARAARTPARRRARTGRRAPPG